MQGFASKCPFLPASFLTVLLIAHVIAGYLFPVDSLALIGLKEGDRPKQINLNDLDGNAVNVASSFGNKPVILVFWELTTDDSFLDYSLDELRFLNNFHNKYHESKGLEIFAIYTPVDDKKVTDGEISKVRNLIVANKLKFPILIDEGFHVFKDYGIIALPSTVMVGTSGKIQFIYPSFPVAAYPIVSDQIKELIDVAKIDRKEEPVQKEVTDSQSYRLYRYALQMYKKELYEQSFSSLKKALDLNPDYAWSHNLMGIILWKKGVIDGSADEFKKALALDNDNIATHLNYAVLLFEQRKYDEAEKILVSSPATQNELKVRAHYLLGLVYKETNRIDQSIQELDLAYGLLQVMTLSMDESTVSFSFKIPILRDLSELYTRKGNDKKAAELLHKAVQIALGVEGASEMVPLNQRRGIMLYE